MDSRTHSASAPILVLALSLVPTLTPVEGAPAQGVTLTPGSSSPLLFPSSFTLAPVAGSWNGVGLPGSLGDWNLSIGGVSSNLPAGQGDYAVANGHLGAVATGPAATSYYSSVPYVMALPGTIQLAPAPVSFSLNAPQSSYFGWNQVLRIFEFTVTTAGPHVVTVGGTGAGLHWDLFAPGTSSSWRPRGARIADGAMGASAPVVLGAGTHAIVIIREASLSIPGTNLLLSVTCGSTSVALAPNAQVTVTAPCRHFTAQPAAGRFNVVGVASASNWDVQAGGAASANSGTVCDFLVGDGRDPALPALAGTFTAAGGSSSGRALQAVPGAPLSLMATHLRTWSGTRAFDVLEFEAPDSGDYAILTSGPPSLRIGVHGPAPAASWRARAASQIHSAALGSSGAILSLTAGWHVLVVSDDTNGWSGSGFPTPVPQPYTIRIEPQVPVVTAVMPGLLLAGGPAATITVDGSHFGSGSTVHCNLVPVPTFFVSPNQLQAEIPASAIAAPGTLTLRVWNATGLTFASNPAALPVHAPYIDSHAPTVVPHLTGTGFTYFIQFTGTRFAPGAIVHANGLPRPTTEMGPGLLRCTLGPDVPQAVVRGGIAFNVVNFGTVPSNTVAVAVGDGNNRGTIVRFPLQPAPGSTFGFRLEGGVPGQPLTLAVSLAETMPLTAWPDPVTNLVFGLDPGSLAPITDGIGVFGPASGAAYVPDPAGTAPYGRFELGGFTLPSTPLGIDLSVQAAYLDPSSPIGLRLTWARFPESL